MLNAHFTVRDNANHEAENYDYWIYGTHNIHINGMNNRFF